MFNRTGSNGDGRKSSSFWESVKRFLKDTWLDLVVLAILGGITEAVWVSNHTFTRVFPLTFQNGTIVLPDMAYPYLPMVINTAMAGLICSLIPILTFVAAQIWIRSFDDAAYAILGLAYSCVTGTLFQVTLKKTIGGLRPHFLEVCQPVVPDGVIGTGYQQMMFTIDQVCTGEDQWLIRNSLESFPSGHSQIAFAGLGYLSLYLFTHLRTLAKPTGPLPSSASVPKWKRVAARQNGRPSYWRMALVVAPLLLATYISSTLVLCYHHHAYDVVFGALIGIVMAVLAYRMVFCSVWDPETNYVPFVRYMLDEETSDGVVGGDRDTNADEEVGLPRRTGEAVEAGSVVGGGTGGVVNQRNRFSSHG